MAKTQNRSKRKVSGKIYTAGRKKRVAELGNDPVLTHIGEKRTKMKRTQGGNVKHSLLSLDFVCVTQKDKTTKLKIDGVDNNPANINYTRRNIITKGCIVKTAKGNVKITSRPGQDGVLFGVLVQ